MNVEGMLEDLLSKDPYRIAGASSKIGKSSQDREQIEPFLPYYRVIKKAVAGIALGGILAPNQRFVDKMFTIFDHYQRGKGCACNLYGFDDSPEFYAEKGNITILETVHYKNSAYIEYYRISCRRCRQSYKVVEHDQHFISYAWEKV